MPAKQPEPIAEQEEPKSEEPTAEHEEPTAEHEEPTAEPTAEHEEPTAEHEEPTAEPTTEHEEPAADIMGEGLDFDWSEGDYDDGPDEPLLPTELGHYTQLNEVFAEPPEDDNLADYKVFWERVDCATISEALHLDAVRRCPDSSLFDVLYSFSNGRSASGPMGSAGFLC